MLQKDFAGKMKKDQQKKDKEMAKLQAKMKELTSQIQRGEGIIQMLKLQLEEEKDKSEQVRQKYFTQMISYSVLLWMLKCTDMLRL